MLKGSEKYPSETEYTVEACYHEVGGVPGSLVTILQGSESESLVFLPADTSCRPVMVLGTFANVRDLDFMSRVLDPLFPKGIFQVLPQCSYRQLSQDGSLEHSGLDEELRRLRLEYAGEDAEGQKRWDDRAYEARKAASKILFETKSEDKGVEV